MTLDPRRAGAAMGMLVLTLAQPLQAQLRTDSYVLTMGADTFAVETFTRSPDRIEGEIAGAAIGRIAYTAMLGADGLITELQLRAWAPGSAPDAELMQQARLTVHGDSVIAEISGAAGSVTQRLASQTGALIYLNPSFALMEQLLRHAANRGAEATVPIFMAQGGTLASAAITRPAPDTVIITIGPQRMHAVVRADGRLTRATVVGQSLAASLVEGVAVPLPTAEPPDYSAPDDAPYTAEAVTVPTPAGHTLAGTLTRPYARTPLPAVITITGSGAQDRDQSLPMVRGYRPFREIADTLSRRGIAVLRLDDRGYGRSTGSFAGATSADFADDVGAAIAFLRQRDDIDARRIVLVGHSEGGLIAPMVAATDDALAGIVLIAGPAHTGRDIISYQQRFAIDNAAGIAPAARDSALAAAAEQLEELAAQQPWLEFFLDYDPLPTARRVRTTPVLILQGATDRQVTAEQAQQLADAFRAAGNREVELHVLPDINHLMLHDPDGNPSGYAALPDKHVSREVLGLLADWVARRLH